LVSRRIKGSTASAGRIHLPKEHHCQRKPGGVAERHELGDEIKEPSCRELLGEQVANIKAVKGGGWVGSL
jgi:hypothetical protein